ncbi:MAG: apolipoprotein N-acyltransferase [Bacteroidia bacterium]|nr:apolipoprotein N-acyltransferase [Bacteroidia bacterium]
MSTLRILSLMMISGALLALSWPGVGHPGILFIAWIPFLFAEEFMGEQHRAGNKLRFFLFAVLCMLIWNLGATWWVWNSSAEGSLMAFSLNSLLMALVLLLAHTIRRRVNRSAGILVFIALWMSYEWFHHRWDLTWPWLTLGNAFAGITPLVQWYEFTGTPGGTLWGLAVNFSLYEMIRTFLKGKKNAGWKQTAIAGTILLFPMLVSFLLLPKPETEKTGVHLVAVQPNFDPYKVKFDMGPDKQMDIFLHMAKEKLRPDTRFLLLPETSVSDGIYEDRYEESYSVYRLIEFAREHHGLNIITGASTWKQFRQGETPTPTARQYGNDWYEAYNSALWIDSSGVREVYHKSKLVPGVEQLPYPALFGSLKDWALDLGGTSGSLGTQEEREVFAVPSTGVVAAPVICYESIFGDFVKGYIHKGGNAIFVLTNDGWWGDTPGYRQHLEFARLRAIEFRVPVVRCTNTGVSCVIAPDGTVEKQTRWWTAESMEAFIRPGKADTFYSHWGDWLSYCMIPLGLLSLILPFVRRIQR